MAAALGVLVHSMLEYPIEYAYFLLPTGLCLGRRMACAPQPDRWRCGPAGCADWR